MTTLLGWYWWFVSSGSTCFSTLLEYVSSVEKSVWSSDSGHTDRLLPAELCAKVRAGRTQSPSLVAVRTLVTSFVLAHNGLVCRLASARDHGNRLQQQVGTLQLELRRLNTCAAEAGSRSASLIPALIEKQTNTQGRKPGTECGGTSCAGGLGDRSPPVGFIPGAKPR